MEKPHISVQKSEERPVDVYSSHPGEKNGGKNTVQAGATKNFTARGRDNDDNVNVFGMLGTLNTAWAKTTLTSICAGKWHLKGPGTWDLGIISSRIKHQHIYGLIDGVSGIPARNQENNILVSRRMESGRWMVRMKKDRGWWLTFGRSFGVMSNPARVKTTATYPGAEALKARITFAFEIKKQGSCGAGEQTAWMFGEQAVSMVLTLSKGGIGRVAIIDARCLNTRILRDSIHQEDVGGKERARSRGQWTPGS
ncbi:hypothetical protein FIBSPDRAFT_892900 [Athelia psychrophila]|uniref:Uncharacterized protein n=1 Tax=Athelia psychrophila TaxID=1759441 RepID=A0A166HWV6_9AGAM|nr:hypothetical protein FIBSPDRAFT_892900 [Fibularhizoctonia sp. CBS 109695]